MSDHFDALETRSPAAREAEQFADLRAILNRARKLAPALDRQLGGVDVASLKDRDSLRRVPVLRKSELLAMQQEAPPFAGLAAASSGAMRRLLVSPGPILDPEGHGADWWGAGRALFAAGFRPGDIVLNTFSYHFTPGGFIMESGAHAVGCAVIPAGPGATEQQLHAIKAYKPNAYAGTPDFLKILLEKAGDSDTPCGITKALVSGAAFPPSLQAAIKDLGVDAYQAYATADLGIVAYESAARAGLIVEIVRPGTNEPIADGEVGEIVVTRLDGDYPLLRFGTGDLSKVLPGESSCGRTGQRLAGWLGRADQRTKVKGMFVDPAQIEGLRKVIPGLGRLRLIVSRENEQDTMLLKAESADGSIGATLGEALASATRLKGRVEISGLGSLPNDGKVISDERPIS